MPLRFATKLPVCQLLVLFGVLASLVGCVDRQALDDAQFACVSDADCRAGWFCVPLEAPFDYGVCRDSAPLSPTCSDGVRNGDELDVDCGGSCSSCVIEQTCRTDLDCDSGSCFEGFCAPLDSCRLQAAGSHQGSTCTCELCDPNASCTQVPNQVTCTCNQGFEGDGDTCVDVDECARALDDCVAPMLCVNDAAGFHCECPAHLTLLGGACVCADGATTDCGTFCVDLTSDLEHCGACETPCDPSMDHCSSGVCHCGPNGENCGGVCLPLDTNENCGHCGNVCDPVLGDCTNGLCVCDVDEVYCSGRCTKLQSDLENCGACHNDCDPLVGVCLAGTCTCPGDLTVCPGACVGDLMTDINHCGACGNACDPVDGQCVAGTCVCPVGLTNCGGQCRDLSSDLEHCGACGMDCDPTVGVCTGGKCGCSLSNYETCGANQRCFDTQNDASRCGSCSTSCDNDEICVDAVCRCREGSADCDSNGTCDSLLSIAHCGDCSTLCGGNEVCSMGTCSTAPCPVDTCGDLCTDLQNDSLNCGFCGHRCDGTTTCVRGACEDHRIAKGCSSCGACAECNGEWQCCEQLGSGIPLCIESDGRCPEPILVQ